MYRLGEFNRINWDDFLGENAADAVDGHVPHPSPPIACLSDGAVVADAAVAPGVGHGQIVPRPDPSVGGQMGFSAATCLQIDKMKKEYLQCVIKPMQFYSVPRVGLEPSGLQRFLIYGSLRLAGQTRPTVRSSWMQQRLRPRLKVLRGPGTK